MKHYVFDGSFTGILCCVFEVFQAKEFDVEIFPESVYQPSFFIESKSIYSDEEKAKRVWDSFKEKVDPNSMKSVNYAYLSEQIEAFQHIFHLIVYVFKTGKNSDRNFGNDHVIKVAQIAKSVSRERHRMKAFIRFKKAADGMFYAIINPDFNVIPLIQSHFKNRYANQTWLIYDEKRKYGIYYDGDKVETITLTFNPTKSINKEETLPTLQINDEMEELYDLLWKDYFKSTNITERKNTKLHLQHVPKRYWRYLNEK